MRKKAVGLSLILCCLSGIAHASMDAPLWPTFIFTQPARLKQAGECRIESGFRSTLGNQGTQISLPLNLEYGLLDFVEIQASLPLGAVSTGSLMVVGVGDFTIGSHFDALRFIKHFYPELPNVYEFVPLLKELSGGARLGLATGDASKGLGQGKNFFELIGLATFEPLQGWYAHVNLRPRIEIDSSVQSALWLSTVWTPKEVQGIGPFAEVFWSLLDPMYMTASTGCAFMTGKKISMTLALTWDLFNARSTSGNLVLNYLGTYYF